jgi:hypothetical protein
MPLTSRCNLPSFPGHIGSGAEIAVFPMAIFDLQSLFGSYGNGECLTIIEPMDGDAIR